LHHTTVWRVLACWGWASCSPWAELIQQQDPSSTCHRFVGDVAPHKFRSPSGNVLRQSRQLLHLIAEWEQRFPEKFFPRFATRAGFS
jgi:hypothetical protein